MAAILPGQPAAAKESRACKPGQAMLVVKDRTFDVVARQPKRGRVVCLQRARPPATRVAARLAARRLLSAEALRPRYAGRLERGPAMRRLRPLLPRLAMLVEQPLSRARAAQAASRPTETITQDISGQLPGGVKGELTTTTEAAAADETGMYVEGDGEISLSKGGESAAMRRGYGAGGFAKRCPDAQGRVEATVKFRRSQGGSSRLGGAGSAIAADIGLEFEAKLVGRVGSDGRLRDFTYRGIATATARGAGPDGRSLSRVYRLVFSGGPIARDFDFRNAAGLDTWQRSRDARGWGPRGENLDASELKLVRSLWTLSDSLTIIDGLDRLLAAEKGWYDRAECVELRFDPAGGETSTGGTVEGSVAAHSTAGGGPLAGASITLRTCRPGQVTPTSGSSSLRFTLSDLGREWTKEVGGGCLTGETVSRRGRGVGSVVFDLAPPPPVPLFDVTVRYREVFQCGDVTITTDDYTLKGSLSQRDPADATASIGTGTVSGTYQQVNTNGCTPFDTTTVTDERVELRASYASSGPPDVGFGWVAPNVVRWAGFVDRARQETTTQTGEGDGGMRRFEREITITNLRPSED